ncbi:creatininase family protein [Paenibacillus caseinilyticus]|uniref:Creatinine amidohydrolase n=1 Tax=Paenibacillus mucilaginosus K02 TaxID=997761 RepID=I0BFL3_9BACL|nr:creatininase family protein [Paenibacillus mucilaginosus]AFH61160.1 hypothetical protein B2K_10570 [Paenibacillus mucilaginosus K02]
MTTSSGKTAGKVYWEEMLPWEFKEQQRQCPIVYLPMGLCEPHGQISAFGLDTLKAKYICTAAAERTGGIVAPAMGYHVHESGYHAQWLEEVVGEENPHMTAIPPHILYSFFLYQLRAFINAGFRGIIVVTGHAGGNEHDLRLVADSMSQMSSVPIQVVSDPELVQEHYTGDHAGAYEISQLLYIRPDLVDFEYAPLAEQPGSGGMLAIGADAMQASAELGQKIMESCVQALSCAAARMLKEIKSASESTVPAHLTYDQTEKVWRQLQAEDVPWIAAKPHPGQPPIAPQSRWKPYEFLKESRRF